MSDRNFMSFYDTGPEVRDLILDPTEQDPEVWPPGSWSDTLKLSHCIGRVFKNIAAVGGKEDCLDMNRGCRSNELKDLILVSGGRYCITLKGGSFGNMLTNVLVRKHADWVDIAIGEWSDDSDASNVNNLFIGVQSSDGKPVTYAYRYGSKPDFRFSNVKHLWMKSIEITIYWWVKYAIKQLKP